MILIALRQLTHVVTIALIGLPLGATAQTIDVGRGAVSVHVPPSYDPGTPMPLIMQLHGRGGTGDLVEDIIQFAPLADEYGILYLHPDGRVDPSAVSYWSATGACCNFWGEPDTDADYLIDLIDEMKFQYNVDAARVHIVGFSNGGFMAHRMACEHGDTVASIAGFAGTPFLDPQDCSQTGPVSILQIHGTSDTSVFFTGGSMRPSRPSFPSYPGAIATVEQWASANDCQLVTDTSAPNKDLVSYLPGEESTVTRYPYSCVPGGFAELWTIVDGTHSMGFSATFGREVVDFLYAHSQPPPDVSAVPTGRWGQVSLGTCLLLLGAISAIRRKSHAERENL